MFTEPRLFLLEQFAALLQQLCGADTHEALGKILQQRAVQPRALFGAAKQTPAQIIQALKPVIEAAARVHACEAIADMFLTEVAKGSDGNLYNKLVKVIPQVNQTLGIPKDEFMKLGVVGRDNPSCP